MATTLLYLVRHAEQDTSAGDADPGLSETGEQQAHRLGHRLKGVRFDSVRHSPLRRAKQTAEILATYLPHVPLASSEHLQDRTPIPPASQMSQMPQRYRPFLDQVPQEERDLDARQLSAAVEQLATSGARNRVDLLVTHNFVIGWFVRHAMDAPVWRWMGLNHANCGLTVIQIRDQSSTLVSYNDVGHLDD